MRIVPFALLMLLFAFSVHDAYAEKQNQVEATVAPFVQLSGERQAWLDIAIADMVAGQLSEGNIFNLLEREKLQAFIKEAELQKFGFTEKAPLHRLGEIAQVQKVIFGNFSLNANSIELNLMEMDVDSQKIMTHASNKGSLDDLSKVTSDLVLTFLKNRGQKIASDEVSKLSFQITRSLPAIQQFYEGVNLYDNGQYEEAYAKFLLAVKTDEKYSEARLWLAKTLESMHHNEQAILAYQKIFQTLPNVPEAYDAQFYAAKLLEKKDTNLALSYYNSLADYSPALPQGIESLLRLSSLYNERKDYSNAYKALLRIQSFREHYQDNYPEIKTRKSRFFNWKKLLPIYRTSALMMIDLYREAQAQDPSLKPPYGAYILSPENTEINANSQTEKKSVFFKDTQIYSIWNENFYAAIIPKGYVATGISVSIKGHVFVQDPKVSYGFRVYGFPLSQNYYNSWLGALYGQSSQDEELKKDIYFFGHTHGVLIFQFIENQSVIKDWKIKVHIRPEEFEENTKPINPTNEFYEGIELSKFSVAQNPANQISAPQYIEQYENKNRLSFTGKDDTDLWVVYAEGNLSASSSDLWASHSKYGQKWETPYSLPINSQSNDYAPKIIRAEDGSYRLFWLSQRRGFGWELWNSIYSESTNNWSPVQRVPITLQSENTSLSSTTIPSFSVIQDKKGNWIVTFCEQHEKVINFYSSSDGAQWKKINSLTMGSGTFNPELFEDSTHIYWLAAIDEHAQLRLLRSNDLNTWSDKKINLGSHSRHWSDGTTTNYEWLDQVTGYPLSIREDDHGNIILLFSDTKTGLQFINIASDGENTTPDLVRNISFEPYAVYNSKSGQWLIASWNGDQIIIRGYKHFLFEDNKKNDDTNPIYLETEKDQNGNNWERRFARTRFAMSDTTAVGTSPDGRVWWGIETGAMSLKNNDFFVSDVSMGFFNHFVSDIITCGNITYFSSNTLDTAIIGAINNSVLSQTSQKIYLPELNSSISAMACDQHERLILGTTNGTIGVLYGTKLLWSQNFENETIKAVIPYSEGSVLAGTQSGLLFTCSQEQNAPIAFQPYGPKFPISSLTGHKNSLWVGTHGGGVYAYQNSRWNHYSPQATLFPYFSVKKIIADHEDQGIWFIPDYTIPSQGMGYFDGQTAKFFNPPSHVLGDISDFAQAQDGSIWVGSATTGIYRFVEHEK